MPRSEIAKILGAIGATVASCAALFGSYAATFWLLAAPHHNLTLIDRGCWVSAVYCAMAVGAYFWSNILARIAKSRNWSQQNCRYVHLVTYVPGCVLFLAVGFSIQTVYFLTLQSMLTKLHLWRIAFPKAETEGPFEKDHPLTLFPR